ncbi:8-oxo-dGTP diphosphatase MutT [Marinomonas sp. 2405UD68-3]|uniref:8-oxo-dGTP diphosphatase MutT n=1 Tax=Marinomonas sp. 2405UD68-3 TaxID=3391835 RepID=UPI0039C9033E
MSAGAILKNGSVFLALRSDDKHQGGLWEFPGGKCESGETPEQALIRELNEEVGIHVSSLNHFMSLEHDYGDKKVNLSFFIVDAFEGEPRGVEGQIVQWVPVDDLLNFSFPKANEPFIEGLMQRFQN